MFSIKYISYKNAHDRTIFIFCYVIIFWKIGCANLDDAPISPLLPYRKIILLINFIFDPTFFLIASYQILKNYAILIKHESFFQRKDFSLHRFWLLKINFLMAETIKKHFPNRNFHEQIAEFDNNLFIFENWKWLSCRESFSWKSDLHSIKIA